MPTRFLRLIVPIAGLCVVTSCFSYRDIEVKDVAVDNFTMQGSKFLIDFSATVHNPNRAFVIQSAEGELSRNQKLFGAAQLLQSIVVPGKTEERCSGQIQLSIYDYMAALQVGTNFKSLDMSQFLFTGDVRIKTGCVKKKFKAKEMPLGQLIDNLSQ